MAKRTRKAKKFNIEQLPVHLRHINVNAAGIDIGSDMHMAAVPEGRDEDPVRKFGAFTQDLHALADWLQQCGVTTVAMESTGVYWIPLYEILEERGLEVKLVDARHVKNVSGRKSDVLDCQWIQELHTYGLLAGAFRPPEDVCALRSYMRQKEMLTQGASTYIQRMQKALQQMNLVLHNVVSDITGMTGMKILKAIIAGERNPEVLAENRDERCHNSKAVIAKSLVGNYRDEHVFALAQAVALYEVYQCKIAECEAAITKHLGTQPNITDDERPDSQKELPLRRCMRGGMNIREKLFKMVGVDLFAIPGLGPDTLLTLAGEVGFDMTPWKTEKHFTSWLGLCPGTKISGGKRLGKKTKRTANRAAQAFRMAASGLSRGQTHLGAFYRRIRSRTNGIQAITATARKIALIYYSMLKNKMQYAEAGQAAYEKRFKEHRINTLTKQARALGYELVLSAA